MNRIHRTGKIMAALTLLAVLAGCVIVPGYYGPPPHHYYGYYR